MMSYMDSVWIILRKINNTIGEIISDYTILSQSQLVSRLWEENITDMNMVY